MANRLGRGLRYLALSVEISPPSGAAFVLPSASSLRALISESIAHTWGDVGSAFFTRKLQLELVPCSFPPPRGSPAQCIAILKVSRAAVKAVERSFQQHFPEAKVEGVYGSSEKAQAAGKKLSRKEEERRKGQNHRE